MNCRICHNNNLIKFLDLGFHPPSDAFLTEHQLQQPETYYPLEVYFCDKCKLVQLGYVVPKEILFSGNYPYTTGTNAAGVQHFRQFAKETVECFTLGKDDLVVDIGSNDGTLLQGFKNYGCRVLGVEPVTFLADMANQGGIFTYNDFWKTNLAHLIQGPRQKKAKIITATNVFAHVADLHDFMKGIDILLDDKGVFIIEAPYLLDLIDNLEYDTIYHEHLSYLAVEPLLRLLLEYNMHIFDIERIDFHGGSMRYFIGRIPSYVNQEVRSQLDIEKEEINLLKLENFAHKVDRARDKLIWYLLSLKRAGKSVVGVCASAKGNTLLNYCHIDLPYITEKSTLKIGKFTPGMHIPVISDDKLIEEQPDYALLLACNFEGSIPKILKEKGYKGRFILPWPTPRMG